MPFAWLHNAGELVKFEDIKLESFPVDNEGDAGSNFDSSCVIWLDGGGNEIRWDKSNISTPDTLRGFIRKTGNAATSIQLRGIELNGRYVNYWYQDNGTDSLAKPDNQKDILYADLRFGTGATEDNIYDTDLWISKGVEVEFERSASINDGGDYQIDVDSILAVRKLLMLKQIDDPGNIPAGYGGFWLKSGAGAADTLVFRFENEVDIIIAY
jgi:hypothetical protein